MHQQRKTMMAHNADESVICHWYNHIVDMPPAYDCHSGKGVWPSGHTLERGARGLLATALQKLDADVVR